ACLACGVALHAQPAAPDPASAPPEQDKTEIMLRRLREAVTPSSTNSPTATSPNATRVPTRAPLVRNPQQNANSPSTGPAPATAPATTQVPTPLPDIPNSQAQSAPPPPAT